MLCSMCTQPGRSKFFPVTIHALLQRPMLPGRFHDKAQVAFSWHFSMSRPRSVLALSPDFPGQLYDVWSPGDAKIAQLELLQVLIALVTVPERFRGRQGTWYIDNTAALLSLIKGRSSSTDLEQMRHLLLFSLCCWIYWEWVPSKSNWADAISREGFEDL